tara:strand:+ start:659 stop:760 length:102 start_codon:yes stop_codon:yes gene_type:complete
MAKGILEKSMAKGILEKSTRSRGSNNLRWQKGF